jgi:NADH-quinone oxidoreductase subunit D
MSVAAPAAPTAAAPAGPAPVPASPAPPAAPLTPPRSHPGELTRADILGLAIETFPGCAEIVRPNSIPCLLVPAADLPAVARFLRDDPRLRFDSLLNLSGEDLQKFPGEKKGEFPSDRLVVIYHLHSQQCFHQAELKVELPRNAPAVPTVTGVWPVADLFEREAFDLYGIDFTGHRDLRRLLTPEDWVGYPLRKDYVYPTDYGGVPLRRDGQHFEDGPYADAPAAPASPATAAPAAPAPAPKPAAKAGSPAIEIERTSPAVEDDGLMTLNMGPHHPSTHGVLRLIVRSDGEVVSSLKPDIGYLHRSIEKIGEFLEYPQFVPYTDRVDYVCAMNANWAYCLAAEAMLSADPKGPQIVVPERAQWIRILVCELNRISSHLVAVGALAMDMGAYTPFLHAIAGRELINDLFERICGARLTYNYITIGGVGFDLPAGIEADIATVLDRIDREMTAFNRLITGNSIFRDRLAGVATVSAADAVAWGLVGPNLRGSGVDYDLRRDEAYGFYPRLRFQVPVGDRFAGARGARGDCYDRYIVRLLEILESISMCRQILPLLPAAAAKETDPVGGWQADIKPALRKVPKGEVFVRSEMPRGETGYYLVSDGTKVPYRVRIRTGSFTAIGILPKLAPSLMIGDIVAVIGSLDIVLPEVDR